MEHLLYVCLGGALGSGARYLVAVGLMKARAGVDFPWATFFVNVVGSILLGMLLAHFMATTGHRGFRLLVTTGFMGGFTTYSTFNHETLLMLQRGAYGTATLYAGLTFVTCLGATAGGMYGLKVISG